MPFGSEGVEAGVGLALSGGGFRATLFHLGSLWRLNELGYLPKLNRISSVSGGSITAGFLAVRWSQLQFRGGVAANFQDLIVNPLQPGELQNPVPMKSLISHRRERGRQTTRDIRPRPGWLLSFRVAT